jgi:hypothetical protein
MGIKELLEERDPDFINLPDLLAQMADEGDSSEHEAAQLLEKMMRQLERKGRPVPRWYQLHLTGWDVASDDLPVVEKILADIGIFEHALRDETLHMDVDGDYIGPLPLESDFGFLRSEVYDFLDACGLKLNREAHASCATKPAPVDSEDAVKAATTDESTDAQTTYWSRRQPAPIYGDGFSEEMRQQTTLTKYLQFDTWTPAASAMLVCGLQAPIVDGQLCTEIPEKGAMGLDSRFISASQEPFHEAKRVLGIWHSQVNPPARVRPLDFIRWCQARSFDTAWLGSIEEDALVTGEKDSEVSLATFAEWAVNTMKWAVPSVSGITKVVTAASNAGAATALKMGTNSKEAMNAHIETRARAMYAENSGLNKGNIAKAIAEELKRSGYSGERGDYLSAATIEKAIPTGLTGGRAANGKNRKK